MSSRRSELVEVEVGTGEAPHLRGPHAGPVHQFEAGPLSSIRSQMEQDGVEVEGVAKKQIARRLQLDIKTVRRAVEQPTRPVRASPRVHSLDRGGSRSRSVRLVEQSLEEAL